MHVNPLRQAVDQLEKLSEYRLFGRVASILGMLVEVGGVERQLSIGDRCHLLARGGRRVPCEVVGFRKDRALVMPFVGLEGVGVGSRAEVAESEPVAFPDKSWLGRVVNAMGEPVDGLGPIGNGRVPYPLRANPPPAHARRRLGSKIDLGVRALNTFLTTVEGQRMGIFAAAGGGKSTLLGMLVKGAAVDVTVLALIGERGREVREFLEHELGEEGRRRAVIVCATSDKSSMERAKAAYVATAIAEFFRDRGKKVLFLMDSVTRFARAQREIGLAAGEPPTRRGFPPSVFATLPKLMERVGMNDKGSITALYTVLVEGDDMTEPIADETRSILDGHIILSRKLAASNHFPAIDVLASASRVMNAVTKPEHRKAAGRMRELLAKYAEVELLVKIGEYKRGADKSTDEAIDKIDALRGFLKQRTDERIGFDDTLAQMQKLVA